MFRSFKELKMVSRLVLVAAIVLGAAGMATAAMDNVNVRTGLPHFRADSPGSEGLASPRIVVADALDNARSGDGTLYGYRV
jgi:hypothetical protein